VPGCAADAAGSNWIVDALARNVRTHPGWPVYRYLDAQGNVADCISCAGAFATAQSVAAFLLGPCGIQPGQRVILLYPPGAFSSARRPSCMPLQEGACIPLLHACVLMAHIAS
jgi:acyl-CoA synthetase (AMP-forming)/AMP-acid ligase II